MSEYSDYLVARRKWSSKGVGGTISLVSLVAGASLAVAILVGPDWFAKHVPERMSRFVTALIPLCAGGSVFLVRWLTSPYFVYRDLRSQLRGKSIHEIMRRLVDEEICHAGSGAFSTSFHRSTIELLIRVSDDFGDESDVVAVCQLLDKSGRTDPFDFFELQYGRGSFEGKRLAFLHDAINYLQTIWADQNGLKEVPISTALNSDTARRTFWRHSLKRIRRRLISGD